MSAWARKFRTKLSLDEIRDTLNRDASSSWRGADNDFWGEYVVGRPTPSGKVRIFRDGEYTVVEVSATDDPDQLVAYIMQRMFPTLGIGASEEHGGWE